MEGSAVKHRSRSYNRDESEKCRDNAERDDTQGRKVE